MRNTIKMNNKKPIWVSLELLNRLKLIKMRKNLKNMEEVIKSLFIDDKSNMFESVMTNELKQNDSNI